MKNLILMISFMVLATSAYAIDFHMSSNFTVAPPHNEPVFGDKVVRYRAQLLTEVEWKFIRYSLEFNAWGTQQWQPSSVVGHFPDSLEGSDWGVEAWRYTNKHILEIGSENLYWFNEYYLPIDRHDIKGHGMENNYYWLTGVGIRFF
jgi:hypothetical protein